MKDTLSCDPAVSEQRLVERCREGDAEAWADLISRYQRLIYAVPVNMGLGAEDAEDVFQRVCVALYQRLDSMTARLDTVLQNLNAGEGTAGRLLRDKQLYENMNQTITEIRALVAEITKDPRKYLNVKVSIF